MFLDTIGKELENRAIMNWLFSLLFLIVVLLVALTYETQISPNQKIFLGGTVPAVLPNGLYKGDASYTGTWLGKKFDAADSSGINLFGTTIETATAKYPFKMSVGKGIRDTGTDVIKIDYNVPENPFWLRPVLDEIVQIAPDTYLGKLQIRVGSLFSFSVAYFRLEKN